MLHAFVFAVPFAQNIFPWAPIYLKQGLNTYFFTVFVLVLFVYMSVTSVSFMRS